MGPSWPASWEGRYALAVGETRDVRDALVRPVGAALRGLM